ncbi:TonB-dependent siderophore receptor [uncultured Microscilla sp.]|uniref:TonB-dependent receptor plug domain-containing protein n=1 Tax=uncultured Microscilla sp. TaxID=432653 RepID=UPI00260D655A|nr:TonB-dependent receptor [uncultured Microscilla sp.]
MKKIIDAAYVLLFITCGGAYVSAQDSTNFKKVFETSVQSILALPPENTQGQEIYSASKATEKLFNAPLNAYVLTQEDLSNAGVNTIPEALRLAPGIIVREATNGNFSVHMRGGENAPPASGFLSRSTLLLVDGRPIYSQISGAVFWITIPIDVEDIRQIEIVQGPVSALYGSNAMTGVINIITKNADSEKVRVNLNTGNYQGVRGNMAVNHQSTDEKLGITFLGNFQHRDRFTDQYLFAPTGELRPRETIEDGSGFSFLELIPNPKLAMNRYGLNAFIEYKPTKNAQIELNIGYENSQNQQVGLYHSVISIFNSFSETYYAHTQVKWNKLRLQGSLLSGQRELPGLLPYERQEWDSSLEYDFIPIDGLKITPLFAYRLFSYRDLPRTNTTRSILNSTSFKGIWNIAAGAKVDYKLGEKWRFIGNVRFERFRKPENMYTSYQFMTTYKPVPHHILRLVVGKSNVAPSVLGALTNLNISTPTQLPGFNALELEARGYREGEGQLNSQNIVELGYRNKLGAHFSVDFSAYYSITQDYARNVITSVTVAPPVIRTRSHVLNVKDRLVQRGVTFSIRYQDKRFKIEPFISLQRSNIDNFSPYLNTPEVDSVRNIENTMNIEHKATPMVYGGFVANYNFLKKFNANVNGYFFSKHLLTGNLLSEDTSLLASEDVGAEVPATFLINVKLSYQLNRYLKVFGSARNLMTNKVQSYLTDTIRPSWWFGLHFTL